LKFPASGEREILAHDSGDDDDAELIQGDDSSCRVEANSNCKR
jgi:hypothetical protein